MNKKVSKRKTNPVFLNISKQKNLLSLLGLCPDDNVTSIKIKGSGEMSVSFTVENDIHTPRKGDVFNEWQKWDNNADELKMKQYSVGDCVYFNDRAFQLQEPLADEDRTWHVENSPKWEKIGIIDYYGRFQPWEILGKRKCK